MFRTPAFQVIELPEDFRDLLIELADASAEFVLVGDADVEALTSQAQPDSKSGSES